MAKNKSKKVTYNELKRRYPHASEAFIKRNLDSLCEESRPRPVVQEQEAINTRQEHRTPKNTDRRKNKKVDGVMHKKFFVSVVMRCSDNRRRDNSGALETILDCMCDAVGRLKAMDSNNTHSHGRG